MVCDIITAAYDKNFKTYICGGAIGFDALATQCVLNAKVIHQDITLVMALPFEGQEKKWPTATQETYHSLLSQADSIVHVDSTNGMDATPGYSARKMFIRNEYMVNRSDVLVACISDQATPGSSHCVDYAIKKGIPVLRINPDTLEKEWRAI